MVAIGTRRIGAGEPCFVIAEAGVNHNGDAEFARRLVHGAAAAGADAVKFQSFKAERLAAESAPKARYQLETTARSESQREMLRRLELEVEVLADLAVLGDELGLIMLSTPFDEASADELEALGLAAFKIASPDLTNLPLLEHVARKGKPILLSTGMADLAEVVEAAELVKTHGAPLVLLHCVSLYPAEAADANLRAMDTLARTIGVPVGFSDHTTGAAVALAAVALGAAVLEKHFTLDRTLPGPDHRASLEPEELRGLVADIRAVESALGDGVKRPVAGEEEMRLVARRSLAARDDLPAGVVVDESMVLALRPGTGIPPNRLRDVLGRRVARDVRAGELLDETDLE